MWDSVEGTEQGTPTAQHVQPLIVILFVSASILVNVLAFMKHADKSCPLHYTLRDEARSCVHL